VGVLVEEDALADDVAGAESGEAMRDAVDRGFDGDVALEEDPEGAARGAGFEEGLVGGVVELFAGAGEVPEQLFSDGFEERDAGEVRYRHPIKVVRDAGV